MVGLPVAPERPSSSIRRPNRPESRAPRSMSSSQILCPTALSSSNGLVMLIPPLGLSHKSSSSKGRYLRIVYLHRNSPFIFLRMYKIFTRCLVLRRHSAETDGFLLV